MEKLLTADDLHDAGFPPPHTLAQWRYLNKGPAFVKVGRHIRYRREDVDAWLDENTVSPGAA